MARSPSTAGLVLAAGSSTRMGSDKALLFWHGQPFVAAHVRALQPHTELVLVVAGNNADDLAPFVYANGGSLVVNPDPARGQFSSLQVGLREVLNRGRDAAMISLVDRPPLSDDSMIALRAGFLDAVNRGKWAVVPEYHGTHGHPVIIAREMMEAYLRAPASANARDIQDQHRDKIEYISVDDAAVVANINTPQEYQELTARG